MNYEPSPGMALFGLVITILMIVLGGGFRTEVRYDSPSTVNEGTQISFHETATARHWLIGLVKGKQPDLQNIVTRHLRNGDQVTSLRVVTRHSLLDGILLVITMGIYTPVTVDIDVGTGAVHG